MDASLTAAQHAALQEAAGWYATLLEAEADSDAHARWQQWLQGPGHAQAWAQVEAVSRQFQPLRAQPLRQAVDAGLEVARRGHSRRRVLRGLASLAALGVAGANAPWLHQQWQVRTADYRTGTGEVRETGLADGTRLWLAPGSAMDVHYRATERRLQLHAGQLLVDAAEDVRRAFVVDTAWARLSAVRARFGVKLQAQALLLAVYEGAVEIRTAAGTRIVHAGLQALVDASGIDTPRADAPSSDAWTRGLLVADQMPLGELVAELARYRHGHLGIDPQIAHLPVVGVFPLRDPDAALQMLEHSLPVRVQRTLAWWLTVQPSG